MNWLWQNYTKIGFGKDAVKKHLGDFIKPGSKVLVTFGGGSIEKNGVKNDVVSVFDKIGVTSKWEGGIQPNPDVSRCIEIAKSVKEFNPDLVLAVGGGSVIDATKLIVLAAVLPDGADVWDELLVKLKYPENPYKFGSVLTISATGTEWNSNFVISRRETEEKLFRACNNTFPQFSLVDPTYQIGLPVRQLRNGVYDAITHVIDQFLTPQPVPMIDDFWLSILKELIVIGPDVTKPNPSYELVYRLAMSAAFALNFIFTLGKEGCWGIHMIGHQLTSQYGIDHGATLSIVSIPFLESQYEARKVLLARSGEYVFGIKGSIEEQAKGFIAKLKEFIKTIGQPLKVSEWPDVAIKPGDVDKVTKMVIKSVGGGNFGYHGSIDEATVKKILTEVIQ